MIGLLLPRIEFSGRVSRSEFWREIALSIVWTPIVIMAVGLLAKEATIATEGLAGTGLSATSLASLTLFAIGTRNMVATLGVIKRRMNDRGYGESGLLKVFWPAIAGLVLLPFAAVIPLLLAMLPITVMLQFFLLARTASDLLFGSSHDATPSGTVIPAEEVQVMWQEVSGKLAEVAPSAADFTDKLLTRVNESFADAGKALSAAKAPPAQQPRVRGSGRKSPRPAPPQLPPSRQTSPVRATRRPPRSGRTTWLGDLLAGPWR
jgi:uncharacterized membrane protein YhaH (DUF805 family)